MQLIHLGHELLTRALAGHESMPPQALEASVVAVGSFDGLHPGHWALIDRVRQEAKSRGVASCLFTFREHPRQVLNGGGPRLLTSWREKLAILQDAGLDAVVVVDFCPALSRLTYVEFVDQFLVGMLGMTHLVGGHDLHLGADRGGSAETLAALGESRKYGMTIVPALSHDAEGVISSSAIRRLVSDGDVAVAAKLLGRPYSLWGDVGYGSGVGEGLGFPTANLRPLDPEKVLPATGVYAVRVHLPLDTVSDADQSGIIRTYDGALPEMDRDGILRGTLDTARAVFRGMLNHGTAPTVHPGGLPEPRLEVHILDYTGYIRERSLKVEWIGRLRDEQTFADLTELQQQLDHDEMMVRKLVS
jgi:riboflavin kinase / FMN adenylyltransferase